MFILLLKIRPRILQCDALSSNTVEINFFGLAAVEGGAPFVTNFSSPNLKPPVSLLFVINCWWYIRNYIYENLNTWARIMYK